MIFNGAITNDKLKYVIQGTCNASTFSLNPTSKTVEQGDNETVYLNTTNQNASIDELTITDNGVNVKSQFNSASSTSVSRTISRYATSYSSPYSSSINGYISYADDPIGIGAETTSTSSNNMYYDSQSGTAYIDYSFDFSDLSNDAIITSMTLLVKGHAETNTSDSTHVAKVQVVCNDSIKSDGYLYNSTTDSIQTIDYFGYNGGMTVADLKQSVLRFTIGYYGGCLTGMTWEVTVQEGSLPSWSYALNNINENHSIVVS